ncbi:hypothetical protein HGO97_016415 [Faecalicatena sp. AGMB00832]|uniref:Repeat protein (TIGR02543 family) n=1 Tax=Faecalicatena faecalis TaxID=2726362 RepID=A0ABS6D7Z4_9FIRM|nr:MULTISPECIES: hypothetical protein [Faecalicatena]MBU3877390.1 hypothetical protein [Faecalicatena faecalis]MCI6465058.1 hypothetical protein [Faecalicatena sp.]MDY5617111.1 hypothetical protein [Lachnospiraceae bacterium]
MKNAVIGFFMVIILIFSGVAIQTSENRTARQNELDNSLGAAMEQSMKILTVNPVYHIEKENGTKEFTADFIQGFLMKMSSDSKYTIDILDVDVEKGLLDVRVSERYKQVIGYGSVSSHKTVILEDQKEEEDVFYPVSFLAQSKEHVDSEEQEYVLKQVSVHGGDHLTAAVLPRAELKKEGYVFCGWRMVEPVNGMGVLYGIENINTICVREEIKFQAVYKQEERL